MKKISPAYRDETPGAPRCNRITLKAAKAELKQLGMVLKKDDGEYRVTFKALSPARAEAVAHYTNDLDDAVATANEMHARRSRMAKDEAVHPAFDGRRVRR